MYNLVISVQIWKKPGVADLWVYQYSTSLSSGSYDHVPTDFIALTGPELVAHAAAVKSSELYVKFGTPE